MTRSWRIPFTNKRIRWIVYEPGASCSYEAASGEHSKLTAGTPWSITSA